MASDFIDVTLSLYPQGSRSVYCAEWSAAHGDLPSELGDTDITLFPELFEIADFDSEVAEAASAFRGTDRRREGNGRRAV